MSSKNTDRNQSPDEQWFKRAFGELYPLIYSHRNSTAGSSEIRSLINWLPIRENDKILDICCGEGRHLKTLLDLGFNAWGLDLSLPLLRNAQLEAALGRRIFCSDIRLLPVKRSFTIALNLFSSFGYFLDDAENVRAMDQMIQTLIPGGVLVIDHINRSRLEKTLVPESKDILNGRTLIQRRKIADNRVRKTIVVENPEGANLEFTENVRLYSPDEMIGMMDSQGCKDISLYGSFSGEVFTSDSQRMIAVGHCTLDSVSGP